MKSKTKKLVSLLLACVLMLSLASVAFAVEEEEIAPHVSYIWMGIVTDPEGATLRTQPDNTNTATAFKYLDENDEMILDQLNVSGINNSLTWVHGTVTKGINKGISGYVAKYLLRIEYITIP